MPRSSEISFADDAIEDVIRGLKSETLRLGEEFEVGDLLRFVRQDGQLLGRLRITAKETIRYGDIGPRDVQPHNSKSLQDLRARLLLFYPGLTEETILTRYRFQFQP